MSAGIGDSKIPLKELDEVVARSPEVWAALRENRLFITGGTGFFGLWLISAICYANRRLGANIEVVALTRRPDEFTRRFPEIATDPAVTLWSGDVRHFKFPEGTFDRVIHAASDTSVQSAAAPYPLLEAQILGTERVLEFCSCGKSSQLLFVSSGAVYGEQPPTLERLKEGYLGSLPPNLHGSAYGLGKLVSEYLVNQAYQKHGLDTKIARCFTFIGQGLPMDAHFAVGNFILDAIRRRDIVIHGDGTPVRSYLYVGDMVTWLLTILVRGKSGETYNVGSDKAVTIGELAQLVSDEFAPGVAVKILGRHRETTRLRYLPDVSKANSELGLKVWTSLGEAIRRASLPFRKNQARSEQAVGRYNVNKKFRPPDLR
jgi:nucleoside-diphosphate-sugar epimerase